MKNNNQNVYIKVPLALNSQQADPEELRRERIRQRENWSDWLPQSASLRSDVYHSGGDLFRDEYPDYDRIEGWEDFEEEEIQIASSK